MLSEDADTLSDFRLTTIVNAAIAISWSETKVINELEMAKTYLAEGEDEFYKRQIQAALDCINTKYPVKSSSMG